MRNRITFAVATYGTGDVLRTNFLTSPCLAQNHGHQILIQKDYPTAGKAYNNAIEQAENDLMIFAHQDMVFPEGWLSQVETALDFLAETDPHWGVLGCYGQASNGMPYGYIYSPGRGVIGAPFRSPAPIQTLDEIVLIFRKSSGLRFDEQLPHFHLYGTDICLRAAQMGRKNYAIPAFCIHNAHLYTLLPKEFYACWRHIQRVWKEALPVQTTCLQITADNMIYYRRRLLDTYMHYIRRKGFIAPRATNIPELLAAALAADAHLTDSLTSSLAPQ